MGLEAKSIMDKGQLVPDAVVVGMISSALEANPQAKGFLFDGFPRTVAQSEALDKLLQLKNTEIGVVLALEVGEEELDELVDELDVGEDFAADGMVCSPDLSEMHQRVDSSEECSVEPSSTLRNELRDGIYIY